MDALIWDRWLRDFEGNWFFINDYIASFVNAYRADMPDKRAIINTPDGEGAENIAEFADVDVIYSELWGGSAHYIDFKHRVDAVRRYGSKATVFPAYMNSEVTQGHFNDNSVRLTAAAIFACGASQIALGDGNEMLRTAYFPENNVKMSDTLRPAMRSYYSFLVAYQNLLRGDAVSADHGVWLQDTATSSDAQAGTVWTLAKKAPGYRIVHLVNLLNNWSTEWRDAWGQYPQPPTIENKLMKIYLNVGVGTGKVWWASPDVNHGRATELPFITGHDDGGAYVEFVLPRLEFWSMVWVEVNEPRSLANRFWALNYDSKSGVDILYTADEGGGWMVGDVKNTHGDSWVGYGHMDFGDGMASLSARVASGLDYGEIEFRLHSPSGPVIATVPVGNTGGWEEWRTVTVTPIQHVSGAHHLFAVFRHQAANLNWFEFEPSPPVGLALMNPAGPVGCEPVEILFDPRDGPLHDADSVYVYIGRNNWRNILIPSPAMHRREDGRWTYTYEMPSQTEEINVVFHDGNGTWDNNNARDWHFVVDDCVTPAVTHEPATPVDCDAFLTVRYDANGRLLENAAVVFIHIGRNDWQDVLSPSPSMTALADNTWEFVYALPEGTTSIDLSFWDGSETWDNNDGQDWTIPVVPCVTPGIVSVLPAAPTGCEPVEILYTQSEGPLQQADPVYIHIGRNGWQDVLQPSPVMFRREDGLWSYTYAMPLQTEEINFVFHDGGGMWDNNNYRDWSVPVAPCKLQPADAAFEVLHMDHTVWTVRFPNTQPGRFYDVYYSSNLLSDSWSPIGFDAPGNGAPLVMYFTNTLPATFYRTGVRVEE
jgi:hypothetical protein